ncbi:TPA: PAAR domain-containing protein [Yersinia enterocolitica]
MARSLACLGDKTTRGEIRSASSTWFEGLKAVAQSGDLAWCGVCKDTFQIIGTVSDWAEDRPFVATGDRVMCRCPNHVVIGTARQVVDPIIERQPQTVAATRSTVAEPQQFAQSAKKANLPPYLTGDKTPSEFVPVYPVLRNTRDLPDLKVRDLLRNNNQDIMFLTPEEAYEVLADWGTYKKGWVDITQSSLGEVVVNYGTNVKDVVTTSKLIVDLGGFGIQATTYFNHKGTELIKLTGYPGIRKVLNAPVFAAKNPKVVDLGIGKYGLNNSIVQGARLTFYVAAAFKTVDYIINDETSLTKFIGSLATDVVKIGISSASAWGAGIGIGALTGLVAVNLVVVVGVGLVVSIGLNYLDKKFGFTDKLVEYIESAQQEFVEKARELEADIWDIGAMYADNVLHKGKEIIEYEVRKYIRQNISELVKVGW